MSVIKHMQRMSEELETNLSLNDSLLEQLECPVCGEYCTPPIFMCVDGHNVCGRCQPMLTECPVCGVEGQPLGRCLIAEKIGEVFKQHFMNGEETFVDVSKMNGSRKKVSIINGYGSFCAKPKQESYRCAVYYIPSRTDRQRCVWEGSRRDLVYHVRKEHPRHYSEQECVTAKLKIMFDKRIDYTVLVLAHGELFWVEFWYEQDDSTTYLWASYIGTAENAANYECEFKYCSTYGHIKVTCCNQILAEGESVFVSPSVLPLEEMSMEKLISKGYFSFTARILKK